MQSFRMKRLSQQVHVWDIYEISVLAEIMFPFKREASKVLKVISRLQLICASFKRALWSGCHS